MFFLYLSVANKKVIREFMFLFILIKVVLQREELDEIWSEKSKCQASEKIWICAENFFEIYLFHISLSNEFLGFLLRFYVEEWHGWMLSIFHFQRSETPECVMLKL